MSGMCNGTLSPAEQARLDAILSADEEARRVYGRFMLMHGDLMWCLSGDAAGAEEVVPALAPLAEEPPVPPLLADSGSPSSGFFASLVVPISYALSALPIVICIVAALAWTPNQLPQRFVRGAVVRPSAGPAPAAASEPTITGEPKPDPYSHSDL
jgi:hypothetical protein